MGLGSICLSIRTISYRQKQVASQGSILFLRIIETRIMIAVTSNLDGSLAGIVKLTFKLTDLLNI